MLKAAFGKAVINGLWPEAEGWGYRDDVEARAAYFEGTDQRLLLVSMDVSILSREDDLKLRQELSDRVGLATDEILVHAKQTHNAVPYTELYLDQIAERVSEAIEPGMECPQEAELGFACADVGSKFTVNRRQYVNDDLGVCTFWYGYRKVDDRADAAYMVNELRKHITSDPPLGHYSPSRDEMPTEGCFPPDLGLPPVWFDRPVDPLVHLLVFRTPGGETIGSILRLAVHVTTAGMALTRDRVYTADFPAYTRARLEHELGGMAMFVSGMAGDLVPLHDEYGWDEVERYGTAVADAALAEYGKGVEFRPVTRFALRSRMVDLPIRPDLPASAQEAEQKSDMMLAEIKRARELGAPMRQLKRMLDVQNHYVYSPKKLFGWKYVTPDEVRAGTFSVRVTGGAFDDILLVGMPGEAMCETTLFLRANSIGAKLLTLYDCNGDVGYLPEARDYDLGGYEVACSVIDRDGERYLREGALALIRELC